MVPWQVPNASLYACLHASVRMSMCMLPAMTCSTEASLHGPHVPSSGEGFSSFEPRPQKHYSLHACACAVRPNSRAHGTARQDYDRKSVTKTISKFCHRVGFVTKFQFMQACRVLFPQVDRFFNFGWTIEPEL